MKAPNTYRVPKDQWKKWNTKERSIFNRMYKAMYYNQEFYSYPGTPILTLKRWKTTVWNAAWTAADLLRDDRLNGVKDT